jgi:hypothetical protein
MVFVGIGVWFYKMHKLTSTFDEQSRKWKIRRDYQDWLLSGKGWNASPEEWQRRRKENEDASR